MYLTQERQTEIDEFLRSFADDGATSKSKSLVVPVGIMKANDGCGAGSGEGGGFGVGNTCASGDPAGTETPPQIEVDADYLAVLLGQKPASVLGGNSEPEPLAEVTPELQSKIDQYKKGFNKRRQNKLIKQIESKLGGFSKEDRDAILQSARLVENRRLEQIAAYRFEIRSGIVMQNGITAAGGINWESNLITFFDNDSEIGYTALHEFGHVNDQWVPRWSASSDKEFIDAWKSEASAFGSYAASTPLEGYAEWFAEFSLDPESAARKAPKMTARALDWFEENNE